jgi:hypothetical protein
MWACFRLQKWAMRSKELSRVTSQSLLFHFSYLFCLFVGFFPDELVYSDGTVNAVFCATAGQTFSLVLVGIPEGK